MENRARHGGRPLLILSRVWKRPSFMVFMYYLIPKASAKSQGVEIVLSEWHLASAFRLYVDEINACGKFESKNV